MTHRTAGSGALCLADDAYSTSPTQRYELLVLLTVVLDTLTCHSKKLVLKS